MPATRFASDVPACPYCGSRFEPPPQASLSYAVVEVDQCGAAPYRRVAEHFQCMLQLVANDFYELAS